MEDINIPRLIESILWGKSMVEVQNNFGHNLPFILRSLSIKESNYINYIYDKEYENALDNGLLKQEDLEQLFLSIGIWSKDNDFKIDQLKHKLKIIKVNIKNAGFLKSKKKVLEQELKKTETEINNLISDKNSLFLSSAESRAEEVKRRYLIMLATENLEEQKYWPQNLDFLNETDNILIFNLAMAYYKNNWLEEKVLRKIARSPLWWFRWKASKNGADLFGKSIADWSESQNLIVYWSQYYDQIFEHPERPGQNIIDDDAACDAWFDEQSKKASSSGDNNKNMFGTKKATTTKNHQEQFIMVNPKDKEAIKEIQDMNPQSVRERLRAKYDYIKKANRNVSERELIKSGVKNG